MVSTDRFVIEASVDDTEVGEVAVGDEALVSPTGGSPTATGSVSFVGLVSTGNGIPSFPVDIAITNPPSTLYAGTFAHVSIVVKQLRGVLEVPTAAISYRQGRAVVTLAGPSGTRTVQPITVGTSSNGMTEVTGGLSRGEHIVEHEDLVVLPTKGAKGTKGAPVAKSPPVQVTGASGVTVIRGAAGTVEIVRG